MSLSLHMYDLMRLSSLSSPAMHSGKWVFLGGGGRGFGGGTDHRTGS